MIQSVPAFDKLFFKVALVLFVVVSSCCVFFFFNFDWNWLSKGNWFSAVLAWWSQIHWQESSCPLYIRVKLVFGVACAVFGNVFSGPEWALRWRIWLMSVMFALKMREPLLKYDVPSTSWSNRVFIQWMYTVLVSGNSSLLIADDTESLIGIMENEHIFGNPNPNLWTRRTRTWECSIDNPFSERQEHHITNCESIMPLKPGIITQ